MQMASDTVMPGCPHSRRCFLGFLTVFFLNTLEVPATSVAESLSS